MSSHTQFRALPNEIILNVVEWLDDDYFDLASLARVDRRCHDLVNPLLYKVGRSDAMAWAVDTDNLLTLQAVLRYSTEPTAALVNATVPDTVLLTPDCVAMGENLHHWRMMQDWHDWRDENVEGELTVSCEASLLHISCANGHINSTKFLLENGADMHHPVQRFCHCLHLEDQVQLNHDGEGEFFDGEIPAWLPLHHALCSQVPEVALLLLEKGASLRVTPPSDTLVTALQCSAAHGAVDIVKYLLQCHHQNPTDETHPATFDDNGYTAMHYLALCYDRDAVLSIAQQLIDVGLNVDVTSEPGEDDGADLTNDQAPFGPTTALALACYLGNFSAAEALLQLGASKSTTINGDNCLEAALSSQWTTWTRARQDKGEWESSRLCVVRQLVLAGVSADPWGLTSPLMYAAKFGLHAEMELLLNFCAVDVERADENGQTALSYAVACCWPRAVEMLLHKGADVNVMDRFGLTPIRGLDLRSYQEDDDEVEERRLEVLRVLLRNGANCGLMGQNDSSRRNMGLLAGMDFAGFGDLDHPSFHDSLLAMEMSTFLRGRRSIFDYDDNGYYLDEIFKHATPANINSESWQSAVYYLVASIDDTSEFNFKRRMRLCRRLRKFARRFGYLLDDTISNRLAGVINQKVEMEDDAQFIDIFFAMGDEDGVPTNTGVFTREAMLVLAMLAGSKKVVRKLVESSECSVRGDIPSLSNSTLLHLAAITQEPEDIVTLLKLHGSASDVNAVTRMGETALSIMIQRDDRSEAMLEAVNILLTLGADPYFRCQDPTELMPHSEKEVVNLLEPKSGKPLSRCAAIMVGQNQVFRNHAKKKGRSRAFSRLSCLEMVCFVLWLPLSFFFFLSGIHLT